MTKNNNWLFIILINIIDQFGGGALSFGISLFLLHYSHSTMLFASSVAIGPIINLVFLPFVGKIIDLHSHRRLIIIGQMLNLLALCVTLLVFLIKSTTNNYTILILFMLIIILKITDPLIMHTFMASMIDLIPEDNLQRTNSILQIVNQGVAILSPIIGAAAYAFLGLKANLIIVTFTTLLIMPIFFLIKFPTFIQTSSDSVNSQTNAFSFSAAVHYLWTTSDIRLLLTNLMITNFLSTLIPVGLPLLLLRVIGLSNQSYGLIISATPIGGILTGIILSSRRVSLNNPIKTNIKLLPILGISLALLGIPALLAQPTGLYFIEYFSLNLMVGIIPVVMIVPLQTYLMKTVPQNMQGRIFTTFDTLASLMVPLGMFIFGFILNYVDIPMTFVTVGVIMAMLVTLVSVTAVHKQHAVLIKKHQ